MTAKARKEHPVYSGVLRYFPKALLEIARVSYVGHQQHNDGPMRWDRSKSPDEADALVRHLLEAGTFDGDGIRHTAKVAWRALALLEKELEAVDVHDAADVHDVVNAPKSGTNVPQTGTSRVRYSRTSSSVRDSRPFRNIDRVFGGSAIDRPTVSYDERLLHAYPCHVCGTATFPGPRCGKCQQPKKRLANAPASNKPSRIPPR